MVTGNSFWIYRYMIQIILVTTSFEHIVTTLKTKEFDNTIKLYHI